MMTKYLFVLLLVTMSIVIISGQCPASNQVISCSPKCLSDSECSRGLKCCPNVCNEKSCFQPTSGANSGGHKVGITTATGTYCGQTKCNSFEKCDVDRSTKKPKCVRA